ncbi:MAG: hypothetical protein ACR2RD_11100 [Woeseiaceae bacterium]
MRNLLAISIALLLLVEAPAASRDSLLSEATIPGATLRIEILQPIEETKAAEILEWLRSASSNVSLAYGRFPSPSPRIVVIPAENRRWGGDKPVTFGRVTRHGEEKIELYVNADRPIEEFYRDWTATHEFSHLMLPYLGERHRWISEGFASYYQNVLMSRAGHYTAREAWQKLYSGFERGRVSRPDLSLNEAASAGIRQARMKIYWSGAAIAMMADIELRERSGGDESLDVALDRLQRCCLPSRRTWSGPELFTKLDTMIDGAVFMPLYRRYANANGFPSFGPALERLGIGTDNDRVILRRDGELSAIRDAITDRRAL